MKPTVNKLAEAIIPQEFKKKKFFSVMLFVSVSEMGMPREENDGNQFVYRGCRDFTDGRVALDAYANIPCPASQLIEAYTEEELEALKNEMIKNYKNEKWLDENLYPYL